MFRCPISQVSCLEVLLVQREAEPLAGSRAK